MKLTEVLLLRSWNFYTIADPGTVNKLELTTKRVLKFEKINISSAETLKLLIFYWLLQLQIYNANTNLPLSKSLVAWALKTSLKPSCIWCELGLKAHSVWSWLASCSFSVLRLRRPPPEIVQLLNLLLYPSTIQKKDFFIFEMREKEKSISNIYGWLMRCCTPTSTRLTLVES